MIQATFVELPSLDSVASPAAKTPVTNSEVTPETRDFSDALQRQQQELSNNSRRTTKADERPSADSEAAPIDSADDATAQADQAAIGNVSPATTAAVAAQLPSLPGLTSLPGGSPLEVGPLPAGAASPASPTGAALIEQSVAGTGHSLAGQTANKVNGAEVAAMGRVGEVELEASLGAEKRALLASNRVKFIDGATNGSAVSTGVTDSVQVKSNLLAGGDQLTSLPAAVNSTLSAQQSPTGNGQMVDLITGGGASTGSAPGKPGLAPIDIPVNDPRWGAAVAQRVVMATKQGLQQAQITVTPANLGPIELQIQIQDDKASVTMISPHASVRDLLEGATPRLRELFEQQGLSLQDSHVADQDSERGQLADQKAGDRSSNNSADDDERVAIDNGGALVRHQVGLVDRYA